MIINADLTNYGKQPFKGYKVHTNAFWVTVSDLEGNTVFDRNPNTLTWLDPKHDRIAKALSELESALIEAIK